MQAERISPEMYTEMRAWLADCEWADVFSGEEDFADHPDWWVYRVVERHYEGGVAQFLVDADTTWRPDPDDEMPPSIQRHHHELCVAARRALALRDSDPSHFADYEEMADRFHLRAMAISAEWLS